MKNIKNKHKHKVTYSKFKNLLKISEKESSNDFKILINLYT